MIQHVEELKPNSELSWLPSWDSRGLHNRKVGAEVSRAPEGVSPDISKSRQAENLPGSKQLLMFG